MDASKFITARLVERHDLTHELSIFRFAPEDSDFRFAPGQYATLGVESDGKLVERPYSVASAPHETYLEFFVELVPHGRLTPLLFTLTLGSTITVRRRFTGRFVLDADERTHHLMVATVTGIAPFVSMLREHFRDVSKQDARGNGAAMSHHHFTVIHGASHSTDFGLYRAELSRIETDTGCVKYIPTVSRPHEDAAWRGEVGRVEDVLRKYADELPLASSTSAAYLCGHPQMIENARAILQRARVAPERIHTEQYFPLPKT